jgi:hypothetical protein
MKRWWVKALLVLAFLGIVLGVSFLGSLVRSKGELEKLKDQLRAAGERLDVKDIVPAPTPLDQNASPLFRAVEPILAAEYKDCFSTNPPPAMQMIAPGLAVVSWRQPEIRSTAGTNDWEDLRKDLETRAGAMETLRATAEKARLQFDLDYSKGFDLLLPHLSHIKRSAQWAAAAIVCDLREQNTAAAVTNLHCALVLVKIWDREPLLISQLVRMAMLQIDYATQWELLQATNLTDGELTKLQSDWEAIELLGSMEEALIGERAIGFMTIDRWRTSNSPPTFYGSSGSASSSSGDWWEDLKDHGKHFRSHVNYSLWRSSWSLQDQILLLKYEQILIGAARSIRTNGFYKNALAESKRDTDAMVNSYWSDNRFRRLMKDDTIGTGTAAIPPIQPALNKLLLCEAAQKLAITAIALKRFELKSGYLPDRIELLVPEYVKSVPRDPVDGQAIRYKLNTDGSFLLYSIGANAVDDGGSATSTNSASKSFSWQKGLDWVWPQPATEAEIRAWEASQSSP